MIFYKLIKVSVIIPVYNNPNGLKKVLDSLIDQDFPKEQYEIIVADNHSKDESLDVIHKYREHYPYLVKLVIENKVQSSYAARNKAVIRSKADVLAFTDADCTPAVNWLSNGCKKLIETKSSIVAGKIIFTFGPT